MLDERQNLGPDMRFVELMLPHHAIALEMSSALLASNNPKVLDLAEGLSSSQAKEMRAFKALARQLSQYEVVVSFERFPLFRFGNESVPVRADTKIATFQHSARIVKSACTPSPAKENAVYKRFLSR